MCKFTNLSSLSTKLIWLVILILISDFVCSVLSSPIVLRYQIFPMIMAYTFGGIFMNFTLQEIRSKGGQKSKQKEDAQILQEVSLLDKAAGTHPL